MALLANKESIRCAVCSTLHDVNWGVVKHIVGGYEGRFVDCLCPSCREQWDKADQQIRAAAALLEEAVQLDPQDATIRQNLETVRKMLNSK